MMKRRWKWQYWKNTIHTLLHNNHTLTLISHIKSPTLCNTLSKQDLWLDVRTSLYLVLLTQPSWYFWHTFLNWDWPCKDCILPLGSFLFLLLLFLSEPLNGGKTAVAFTFDKSLHKITSNEWHGMILNTYKNKLFSSYGSQHETFLWRGVDPY